MEYISKDVGRRIASRRRQKNIRQNQLAEKIGISNNHLCEIERGNHNPSIDLFVRICDALDATPDYFLLGNMHLHQVPKRVTEALELCHEEDIQMIMAIIEHLISIRTQESDRKLP